jgi:protein-tyrosine phosphatase
MTSILFICLGNICRSPMAEAIFRHLVIEAGLESKVHIDSAGIGEWHVGKPPHEGTCQVLAKRGIAVDGLICRQVTREDLESFDLIIVMDKKNLAFIEELMEKKLHQVHLLSDFIAESEGLEISDPNYTGEFEKTFDLIEKGCEGLLKVILSQVDNG